MHLARNSETTRAPARGGGEAIEEEARKEKQRKDRTRTVCLSNDSDVIAGTSSIACLFAQSVHSFPTSTQAQFPFFLPSP